MTSTDTLIQVVPLKDLIEEAKRKYARPYAKNGTTPEREKERMKAYRESLPGGELAKRRRQYSRDYRRKRTADPERHAKALQYQRDWRARKKARQEATHD